MRVATVFAHQDDEMRCLGTLLRLVEQGAELTFIVLSDGAGGLPFGGKDREAARSVRHSEMTAVADALGADYRCLDQPDGAVAHSVELRDALVSVLRDVKADVVFTHWLADYNPDHEVTARLAVEASLFVNLQSFVPDAPAHSRVPAIFHVDPGAGYGFTATHFVELSSEHTLQKAALIRRHASQMDVMRQLKGRDYADEMVDSDRTTGARLSVPFAEGFRPCLAERRIPWPSVLPGPLEHEERA